MLQKFWPLFVLLAVGLLTLALLSGGGGGGKTGDGKAGDGKGGDSTPTAELGIEDLDVGKGEEVGKGDRVEVHYVGTLKSNGSEFDSSRKRGEPFALTIGAGGVIQGWDKGLPGMKVGGKRKLIIPAHLAYGSQSPSPKIPPNSDLVFEIELVRKVN